MLMLGNQIRMIDVRYKYFMHSVLSIAEQTLTASREKELPKSMDRTVENLGVKDTHTTQAA